MQNGTKLPPGIKFYLNGFLFLTLIRRSREVGKGDPRRGMAIGRIDPGIRKGKNRTGHPPSARPTLKRKTFFEAIPLRESEAISPDFQDLSHRRECNDSTSSALPSNVK
jgi:hypothetical protein